MNKLLLTLKREFNDDIILVANNHKDIYDYLQKEYDFHKITIGEDYISIIAREGFASEYGTLTWIKHV